MITIVHNEGRMKVPAKWAGDALAVHRPVVGFNKLSDKRCWWTITHIESGMAAGSFEGSIHKAVKLAKAWDSAFKRDLPGEEPNASEWELKDQWRQQVNQLKPICSPDTAEFVINTYLDKDE